MCTYVISWTTKTHAGTASIVARGEDTAGEAFMREFFRRGYISDESLRTLSYRVEEEAAYHERLRIERATRTPRKRRTWLARMLWP